MCVIQFVRDQFEAKNLLISNKVGTADIDFDLWIAQLVESAICHHVREVSGDKKSMFLLV